MKARHIFGIACLALFVASVSFAEDLPSAKDLISKHIAAVGGEAKIRSVDSMVAKGTADMPQGMSAQLEMHQKAPDKFFMKMTIEGFGDVTTGYDGEVAWSDNPMTGPMLIQGEQLKDMQRQADIHADLSYDSLYPTQETVERLTFAEQDAYKVRLVDTDGKESFQYFSVDSGLVIGNEGEQTNDMGTLMVVSEIREYKDLGGFLVPTKIVNKMMGIESVMTMTDVSIDNVDESVFELPESIKTLVGN